MTTNYHTAITVGAAANAATFNAPLGELDAAIASSLTATGTVTGATAQAQSFVNGIEIPGIGDQYPLSLTAWDGSFLDVADPTMELGFNIEKGAVRNIGTPAVWLALEANYANDTYQETERNYAEFYVGQSDENGKTLRPIAFTWDNGDIDNYCQGHIYISATQGFNFIDCDGDALVTVGGDGGIQMQTRFQFAGANPYIQVTGNYGLGLIANSKYVFVSNTNDGLDFGSDRDTNLYRSAAATLKTDHALIVTGDIELDGALNHDGTSVGFYGTAPIAQAVLATGAGATVDDVITALQNLGLVKQS